MAPSEFLDASSSSEKLATGGLSALFSYFGYDGKCHRTLHLSRPILLVSLNGENIYNFLERQDILEAIAWGPTLGSEIPKWFNLRSTDEQFNFRLIESLVEISPDEYGVLDEFYNLVRKPSCWGYALFIVYEVPEIQKVDGHENSNSRIFPVFDCIVMVGEDFTPLVFRIPEVPSRGSNGVWVFINGSCFHQINLRRPGRIKFPAVALRSRNVKVKKYRGRLVYKQDLPACHEIVRSISPRDLDSKSLGNALNFSGISVYGPIKIKLEKVEMMSTREKVEWDFYGSTQGQDEGEKYSMNAWKNALGYLKRKSNATILNILQLRFDNLEYLQKELFLDIACFFKGEKVSNETLHKLKILGYFPDNDIPILKSKFLLKRVHRKFEVHDLLQEMAHEIVYHESPTEPSRRSRLWDHEDIIHVLKNDVGSDLIKGIALQLPLPKFQQLSLESFSNMKNLKMLWIRPEIINQCEMSNDRIWEEINTVEWYGDASKLMFSEELCILEWWGYPLEFLPTSFMPKNLIEFRMPKSYVKLLWDARKCFNKLRCIDMKESQSMIELPNFSTVPNLEELDIKGTLIRQLPSSIISLGRLKVLRVGGTSSNPVAFMLPNSFSCLKPLVELDLSYCKLSEKGWPNDVYCLSSLTVLNLSGNEFTELPVDICRLPNLLHLGLADCTALLALPPKLPLDFKKLL